MTDREKVIRGLECIISSGNAGMRDDCVNCIYPGGGDCVAPALQDTFVLLKAQEPRVMTLEEVIESEVGAVVWLEDIDKPTVIAGLVDRVFTGTMVVDFQCVARTVTAGFDDYGKRWRCWTSCPDEKRRAETPWE